MKKIEKLLIITLLLSGCDNTLTSSSFIDSSSSSSSESNNTSIIDCNLLINIDKIKYEENENITITFTGDGNGIIKLYLKDDDISLIEPIYSGIVNNTTNTLITELTFNEKRNELINLPSNEYKLSLYSTANELVDELFFSVVKKANVPNNPISAKLIVDSTSDGRLDGFIRVKIDKSGPINKDIIVYYANDTGILNDYRPLKKQKVTGDDSIYYLDKNVLIPKAATKLYVYASNDIGLSNNPVILDINDTFRYDINTFDYELYVVSDFQYADNKVVYTNNYKNMLANIRKNMHNGKAIIVNGDITNNGLDSEFNSVVNLHSSYDNLPKMYYAIGNHEYKSGGKPMFLKYSKTENVYYDFTIEDIHIIILGGEEASGVKATISDAQFEFLNKSLSENSDKTNFIFLHQSMYDTVAGSLPSQGWNGVIEETKLRNILKLYPNAIMFNAHSHWEMDSVRNMANKTSELPYIFNTSSVAYLWTSYNVVTGENKDGSEGYYIRVNKDGIYILGKDFISDKWISSAVYYIAR